MYNYIIQCICALISSKHASIYYMYVCYIIFSLSLYRHLSFSLYIYIYIYYMIIYVHLSMIIQHNYGHPHKPAFFQCLMAKVPVKSHCQWHQKCRPCFHQAPRHHGNEDTNGGQKTDEKTPDRADSALKPPERMEQCRDIYPLGSFGGWL